MSKTVIALLVGILLGATGSRLLVPTPEAATEVYEEQAAVAPVVLPDLPEPYYRVLFENDDLRLVDHRLPAGESEPEHTHAPHGGFLHPGRARSC